MNVLISVEKAEVEANGKLQSEKLPSEKPQSEKPRKSGNVTMDIPDCVTKIEDNAAGGKFLCNPCQAHCNSDVQLSQVSYCFFYQGLFPSRFSHADSIQSHMHTNL